MDRNLQLIDDLYAGALDPAAWNRGIRALVDSVSGSAALVFGFNPQSGQVLRSENHGYDAEALAQYNSYWCTKDIRIAAGVGLEVGEPMITGKQLPMRAWTKSAAYNEFFLRTDVPWILPFWLHKAPDNVVALSIQGTRIRGPFDNRDGERIKPFLSHVRRVLEIKDRLEFLQIRCDTLAASLESLSVGVMTLDAKGRILEASASALELLRANRGLGRSSDGTLWMREPAGRNLNHWIAQGKVPDNHPDGLLHVGDRSAHRLSVLITRLPESAIAWFGGGPPRWMVLLFDPERGLSASAAAIERDLAVTAREAEIAALIVSGCNLKAISQRLNISIHTTRCHLKTVFSKTGIRSPTELIRRIASGPARFRSRPLEEIGHVSMK